MGLSKNSNYKLEIGTERTFIKDVRRSPTRRGFSKARKTLGAIIIAMVAAMTIFAGLTVAPSFTDGEAKANLFVDWFCPTKTDPEVWLGGNSPEIANGMLQSAGQAPYEGAWAVAGFPKSEIESMQAGNEPSQKWTTLERFGYMAPSYSNWVGMAPYDETFGEAKGTPWLGTGGDATGSLTGTPVVINNPKNSSFFTTNALDCGGSSGSQVVGNFLLFGPKAAVGLASNLYIASQNLSLTDPNSALKPIGDVMEKLIVGDGNTKGLKDLLFMDFLIVMIVIGAVIIGVQGIIKGQAMQAMQSVVWMVIAAIGGILFMTNPLFVSTVMEDGINTVQSGIQSAILQTNSEIPECALGSSDDQALHREITCTIWFSTIYKPWVEGQFGFTYEQMKTAEMREDPSLTSAGETAPTTAVAADDVKDFFAEGASLVETKVEMVGTGRGRVPKTTVVAIKDLNINTAMSSTESRGVFTNFAKTVKLGNFELTDDMKNWPYLHMTTQSQWPKSQGLNMSEVAYSQLVINNNEEWKHASNAPGSSFMSMLAAGGPVIFLTVIAGSLISFQIVLVFLIVLAPFFLTIGIVPGWGKRVTMRWLEMLASLFIKRLILMLFLLLFMKIYMSILSFQDMNWFIQTLFVIILTIVALTQKDQVTQMITSQINFGSNIGFGDEQQMKAAAVGGTLVAVGVGRSVAMGGLRAGGSFRRRGKKDSAKNNPDGKGVSEETKPSSSPSTGSTKGTSSNSNTSVGVTSPTAVPPVSLMARAGVVGAVWGNAVKRARMRPEEARKAKELREINKRREDVLEGKKRLRDMPEGPQKQQQRTALGDENKARRAAREAALVAAQDAKKKNDKNSQAPQANANKARAEGKAKEIQEAKAKTEREAAAKERRRERDRQKKAQERVEAGLPQTSSPAQDRSNPGNVTLPNASGGATTRQSDGLGSKPTLPPPTSTSKPSGGPLRDPIVKPGNKE